MSRSKGARTAVQRESGPSYRGETPVSTPVWRRVPIWAYVLVLAVIVAGISLPLYLGQRGSSAQSTGTPNSAAPPGVAAVGQSAPGFALNDSYGQTYALTPGDGRAHILVFYMGNF